MPIFTIPFSYFFIQTSAPLPTIIIFLRHSPISPIPLSIPSISSHAKSNINGIIRPRIKYIRAKRYGSRAHRRKSYLDFNHGRNLQGWCGAGCGFPYNPRCLHRIAYLRQDRASAFSYFLPPLRSLFPHPGPREIRPPLLVPVRSQRKH